VVALRRLACVASFWQKWRTGRKVEEIQQILCEMRQGRSSDVDVSVWIEDTMFHRKEKRILDWMDMNGAYVVGM